MALEAQEMLAATQIVVGDVSAGGVMGRQVETIVRDPEFKPEVGCTPLSQQI
jgi:ABC-type branched-subunit amino acid transport system substrate-binding protein